MSGQLVQSSRIRKCPSYRELEEQWPCPILYPHKRDAFNPPVHHRKDVQRKYMDLSKAYCQAQATKARAPCQLHVQQRPATCPT